MYLPHKFHDKELEKLAEIAHDLGATMMPLTYMTTTVATNVLSQITTTGLYLGIHSATPGNTGASEIVGSGMIGYTSGGYTGTRQSIAWAAFATDHQTSNTTQTFPLLATQAGGIPYYSLWTDTGATSHAGTFLFGGPTSGLSGSIPNGANVTFTNGVTLTVTA